VWSHALSGEIVIVRVAVLRDGGGKLKYHRIQRNRGDKQTIKETEISKRSVDKLLTRIDQARFWQMPTQPDVVGLDGEGWTTEGFDKGRCHIVDRWSPKKGSHRRLGQEFLKLQ
jgi:hypothetical protein